MEQKIEDTIASSVQKIAYVQKVQKPALHPKPKHPASRVPFLENPSHKPGPTNPYAKPIFHPLKRPGLPEYSPVPLPTTCLLLGRPG